MNDDELDEVPEADKPSIAQVLGAMIAGAVAVRIAGFAVTTAWRLVTREEPPDTEERGSIGKKAAWIGLVAAATAAARQAARDAIRTPRP